MDRLLVLLPFVCALALAQIVPNSRLQLLPVAGSGSSGDSGPALQAILNAPAGLAEDADGNIYVAEAGAGVIRRIKPDGTIERYAGSGLNSDGAPGAAALSTDLQSPTQLAVSSGNELYFFDSASCRIRKVNRDGMIEAVAGSGKCAGGSAGGFGGPFGGGAASGTDGKALETDLGNVGAMVFDANGLLVFSETTLHIVRRLDADGQIRTIAGSRYAAFSGDSGAATDATLDTPVGLAYDGNGNLYIADSVNCRVRKVDAFNYIDTVAGATSCASSTATYNGSNKTALERTGSIAFDANSNMLMIALPRAYRVVRLAVNENRITPYLGNGKLGIAEPVAEDPVDPLSFALNEPTHLLLSRSYGLLISAASAFHIYRLDSLAVTNFAGRWPQSDRETDPAKMQLLQPRGLVRSADGSLVVIDTAANRMLRMDLNGIVTPIAGTPYPAGFLKGDNGPGLEATLDQPVRAVERSNGDLYIAEATKIRVLTKAGILKTVRTGLKAPVGLVFDAQDRLVYAESGSHRVMRLDLNTNVATRLAGISSAGFTGDADTATSALLNTPTDLAYDAQGNLLIVDKGNRRIRKVGTNGKINTIVGNGLPFSYADITGQLAVQTGFGPLDGMTLDASGNIYVSESKRLTKIAPDGTLTILTGYRAQADDGTISYIDGPLNDADAILTDAGGNLFFSVRRDGKIVQAAPLN